MKENYFEKVNETKEVMNLLCVEQASIAGIKEDIKKNNKMNTEILVIFKNNFVNFLLLFFLERKRFDEKWVKFA